MKFSRTKGIEKLLEDLQKEDLYLKKIEQDLKNEKIFMGLRDNSIDFYYGGSKIYSYSKKGFLSHKKFCINVNINGEYINQNDLQNKELITCPIQNYELIKQNAKKYAGVEDKGISNLFKQDYFSQKEVFLLDIEIALYDKDSKDRVDLLFYDNKNGKLKFIEVKDYTNKELWSKEGTEPKVVEQIKRYNKRLKDRDYYNNILNEYRLYISILNKFFNLKINEPKEIIEKTSLYMFGFDENQKRRISKQLENDLGNIPYYFKGNPSDVKIETIFKTNQNKI